MLQRQNSFTDANAHPPV